MLNRCYRDLHCPAICPAWGHYSCLTDTIFLFTLNIDFFCQGKQHNKQKVTEFVSEKIMASIIPI